MRFRFRRRPARHTVSHANINPHGFNEAERAVWMDALCALHAFRVEAVHG